MSNSGERAFIRDLGAPPRRSPEPAAQLERTPVLIFEDLESMSRQVARRIAELIEEGKGAGRRVVFGLPTGSTPIGVYSELVRMHREEGLDFAGVVTFNIDEYYPMDPDGLQSYNRFMRENFLDHVNVAPENVHAPRGDIPKEEVDAYCQAYEKKIQEAGGFDLVLLGIGRSGHIGFNEPGSGLESRSRVVVLDEITRKDAASAFFGEESVPRQAISMGIGTILSAREIILLAAGEHKASVVRRAVEEKPNRRVAATYLQFHPNATFYLDRAAARELTREKTPWLVRDVEWDHATARRAVIWLSEKLEKAILTLEVADFYRHNLHELVYAYDHVDNLCRSVFEDLRRRVTYRDGLIKDRRVLVFSPHPDDDVISMGGMLDKLVANDNDVTVAYMTNGSVAVFDADVRRYLRFIEMSAAVLGFDPKTRSDLDRQREVILEILETKRPGQIDGPEVQAIKAFIRYAEAIEGLEVMGLGQENARFLDMPFYRTGRVKKDPIGEADVQVVFDLLEELRPQHVFVAGDLSDPHGTHRMCYQAISAALSRYNERHASPVELKAGRTIGDGASPTRTEETTSGGGSSVGDGEELVRPLVWLYRGAWQEWEIHQADVFLPLSKADLDRKVEAIYKHESQKDRAMFPGAYDEREFWQRARDRNTNTAKALNQLGLPEFYAAEAYVTTYDL